MLAKALFVKDYSSVHVTTEKEESIKEFCRMRLEIKRELKVAKQILFSFLLRQNKKYGQGSYWTIKHRNWLKKLNFEQPYLQETFNEYMISINMLEARLKNIENRLEEISKDEVVKERVEKLVCFSDIETLTALTMVAEIGDFNRFKKAYNFAKYLGLTCGENSSGSREKHLSITKCGNKNLRRLLTESTKSIKKTTPKGKKSERLMKRQEGKDPNVIAYADKCRLRLKARITYLERKGKSVNVATIDAARELACFIWGMMTNNIV